MVSYSSPMVTMAVSLTIYEILDVKEWRENRVRGCGCSRSLKIAPLFW